VGLIGIPSMLQRGNNLGIQTELAIQNVVPKPGFTDFAIFLYDQNGLLDYVCEKLNEKQVEYIDLSTWGWVQPGFKGSAVISATFWEHDVFDGDGRFLRNVVGLAALKIERVVPTGNLPTPGDLVAGSEGFPIPPQDLGYCSNFDFEGFPPVCPGIPVNCQPVNLVLILCPPNATTAVSTYVNAPVTITYFDIAAQGTKVINTFVDANGRANAPLTVRSGRPIQVTVGAVLQPVQFGGPADWVELPGFSQTVFVPCQFDTPFQNLTLALTPPPGEIHGYLVNSCAALNIPRGGREIQLWLPPSNPQNQGGTYLTSATTSVEGYFEFNALSPCLVYEN
jgi:hypothetical protein